MNPTESAFITLTKSSVLTLFLNILKLDFLILSSKLFHSRGSEKRKERSRIVLEQFLLKGGVHSKYTHFVFFT